MQQNFKEHVSEKTFQYHGISRNMSHKPISTFQIPPHLKEHMSQNTIFLKSNTSERTAAQKPRYKKTLKFQISRHFRKKHEHFRNWYTKHIDKNTTSTKHIKENSISESTFQ